jgi:hypothetical protein
MIPNYGRNGFFYASAASGDPESPRDNFLRNIKAEKTFHVVLATESILALSATRLNLVQYPVVLNPSGIAGTGAGYASR